MRWRAFGAEGENATVAWLEPSNFATEAVPALRHGCAGVPRAFRSDAGTALACAEQAFDPAAADACKEAWRRNRRARLTSPLVDGELPMIPVAAALETRGGDRGGDRTGNLCACRLVPTNAKRAHILHSQ